MESKLYNYAKCSVPVLNNASPNNYAIMSALLSHIDSPLVSSSSLLSSTINSYPNIMSSLSLTNQTIQSTFSKSSQQRLTPQKHTKCANNHKSSKEIIYTTKKLNITNIEPRDINQSIILLESNSDLNISDNQTNLNNDHFQNDQLNNLVVIEAHKDFEISTTRSMIDSNLIQNTFSIDNSFETNPNQASQILEQINFEAYKNYVFNEQPNFINDHNEQSTISETNTLDSNLVTYTISCSSNWHNNIDKMLNCFVYMDCCKTENIQLKCSNCLTKFYTIKDLAKHKELSGVCLNNVKLQEDFEIEKLNTSLIEHDINDQDENLVNNLFNENENKFSDGMKTFFLNENEFDLSDESNESETDIEKQNCLNNNNDNLQFKVKKKNDQRVRLRDESSEIDKEEIQIDKMLKSKENMQKQNRPRRKYTKNRNNAAANLNCDSKNN